MKKVTRKVKQAISILLVAAMVITMVPQAALSVSAEESVEATANEESVDTTVESAADETKPDAGTVDETEASAEDEDADAEESEEEEADVETDETDTEDAVDEKTEDDEANADEETEDEKSEEGIKKGAFGYEAMEASGYTVAVDATNATVTFTNDCVSGENQIEKDKNLTFKVAATDGYKVTSVKYEVANWDQGYIKPDYGVFAP